MNIKIIIKFPKIGNSLQKTEKHKTKSNDESREGQTRQKLSAIKMIKLKYPIAKSKWANQRIQSLEAYVAWRIAPNMY